MSSSLSNRLARLEARLTAPDPELAERIMTLWTTPDEDGLTLYDHKQSLFGPKPPVMFPGATPEFRALIRFLYPQSTSEEN